MIASPLPNLVSVDDHIVEPPTLWTNRLPRKYVDSAPRVVRELVAGAGGWDLPTGASANTVERRQTDVWHYEDIRVPLLRLGASVGFPPDEVTAVGVTFDEMRPGCYDASARLADMDTNGVDIALCFPNLFVRFCGQRFLEGKDRDLAYLCVKAYNDFLAEEWLPGGHGRLHAACVIPLWDVVHAVTEVERNASRGIRNVCFPEIPSWLGLPSLHSGYWEPFFHTCEETDTVVQMHIGSSSRVLETSSDAPRGVATANLYINSSLSLSDILLSGIFLRHPKLNVAYAESQAGWIPYILSRLDSMWHEGNLFNEARQRLPDPPSSYFRDHVYTCIFDDPVAISSLIEQIGADQICFETDYPHPDGTWPNSKAVAGRLLEATDLANATKIVRSNGLRMLGMTEADVSQALVRSVNATGPTERRLLPSASGPAPK